MSGYFSFQKLISTWFVQVMYFVGFLLISAAGIGLTVWAGLRLRDANISRELGWRYVAAGIGALILGNLLWRVFCECWVVVFHIRDELVGIRHTIGAGVVRTEAPVAEVHDDVHVPTVRRVREVSDISPIREVHETHRSASVLGLS
jgi:Domain of unknown function (DUF4282)